MSGIVLITGSVRSGKSTLAVDLAKNSDKKVIFLATCEPLDSEMKDRVSKHQQARPGEWLTVEEPVNIRDVIRKANADEIIILDCLTLWISNLMHKIDSADKLDEKIDEFIAELKQAEAEVIIVSNEVGWGIVPENKLARVFRDVVGITHQKIAKISKEVYLVIAGISQRIKKTDE